MAEKRLNLDKELVIGQIVRPQYWIPNSRLYLVEDVTYTQTKLKPIGSGSKIKTEIKGKGKDGEDIVFERPDVAKFVSSKACVEIVYEPNEYDQKLLDQMIGEKSKRGRKKKTK